MKTKWDTFIALMFGLAIVLSALWAVAGGVRAQGAELYENGRIVFSPAPRALDKAPGIAGKHNHWQQGYLDYDAYEVTIDWGFLRQHPDLWPPWMCDCEADTANATRSHRLVDDREGGR